MCMPAAALVIPQTAQTAPFQALAKRSMAHVTRNNPVSVASPEIVVVVHVLPSQALCPHSLVTHVYLKQTTSICASLALTGFHFHHTFVNFMYHLLHIHPICTSIYPTQIIIKPRHPHSPPTSPLSLSQPTFPHICNTPVPYTPTNSPLLTKTHPGRLNDRRQRSLASHVRRKGRRRARRRRHRRPGHTARERMAKDRQGDLLEDPEVDVGHFASHLVMSLLLLLLIKGRRGGLCASWLGIACAGIGWVWIS